MDRRNFHRGTLAALTGSAAGMLVGATATSSQALPTPRSAADAATTEPFRRSVTEYQLPPAEQTREIVRVPDTPVVLVTQMSNSKLVKLWLDPASEQVTDMRAFQIATPTSELHGLTLSKAYPGKVWATLQRDNKLVLLDPGTGGLSE